MRQAAINAWMATVCAGDGWSPDDNNYNHHINSGNACSVSWAGLPTIFQSSTIVGTGFGPSRASSCKVAASHNLHQSCRSIRRRELVEMASVPNSGTTALGLLGMVMLVLAHILSKPFATLTRPSLMGLGPVLLDDLHSTGAVSTKARVTRLVLTSITSMSLTVTTVPELRWPESPSLPTWSWLPDMLVGLAKLAQSGSTCLEGISSRLLTMAVIPNSTRPESPETWAEQPGRLCLLGWDSDQRSCVLWCWNAQTGLQHRRGYIIS